jgi:hypothetical protein
VPGDFEVLAVGLHPGQRTPGRGQQFEFGAGERLRRSNHRQDVLMIPVEVKMVQFTIVGLVAEA